MKIDLMRFSETLFGENDKQENVQNCNRSQATPNLQQAEADAQCPCMDGPFLRVPPAFHSDGQSLASCDFMMPSITDPHCSNTDLNNIMESTQSHILDNSGVMDSNRSEEDCMDLQSLSVSFWEAGDEGAESCKLNFSSAFVTYGNSGSLDAIKNQQFNNHPIALSTDVGQSNCSRYDNMESIHRDSRSTCDPHLDTLSNSSYHIDSRKPCKPNYCSKKKMDLAIPYNERYNADTFTTVCPNLASLDLIRRNTGGENDAGRDLSKLRSCSYELVRSGTSSMLYDDDAEQNALKELRLDGISTLEDNALCYKSYTSGYQRKPTGFVHTFSNSCHSHQGASECIQRDSEQQAGLQGSGYWKPMSDIPESHLHNHCGALNSASIQNSCGAHMNQNLFTGVARAFPASNAKRHLKCILTPALEEDWLFDEIELK
nr:uncharacterized protein LOC111853353 [Paramormyrops kingsleyae]